MGRSFARIALRAARSASMNAATSALDSMYDIGRDTSGAAAAGSVGGDGPSLDRGVLAVATIRVDERARSTGRQMQNRQVGQRVP